MRIPLKIENLGGVKRITITFIVSYKRSSIIKFIIDTGCPLSQISEKDFSRMGINVQRSEKDNEIYGIGGGSVNLKRIGPVILRTRDLEITTNVLHLSYSASRNPKYTTNVSLLGTDFLEEQGFKLVVDFSNNIAFLEK